MPAPLIAAAGMGLMAAGRALLPRIAGAIASRGAAGAAGGAAGRAGGAIAGGGARGMATRMLATQGAMDLMGMGRNDNFQQGAQPDLWERQDLVPW